MKTDQTQAEHFRELLETFETIVLTTHLSDHDLASRPMAVAKVEENCDLWFITSTDDAMLKQIQNDSRVQVIGQDGWDSTVVVNGRGSVVSDRAKLKEVWKKSFKVWFPEGEDDPTAILIKVEGDSGKYWDNTGVNRLTYAYEAIKAVLTGTKPDYDDKKQHGTVAL